MRFVSAAALFGCVLLAGCASFPTATNVTNEGGAAIQGSAYGGQQPINLAHVYLMQANTTGYGQASVSLLNAALTGHSDAVGAYVTTNARGFFTITGDYTCTPGTQVYLLVLQGDAGGGNNTAAGELGVFGQCPAAGNFLGAIPFVQINEVTTVAGAYALAGFATDVLHVSSSGTALAQVGIANAFLTAGNIASVVNAPNSGSLSTTPAGNGTVPAALVNTLADIIASCVNSTGPGSPACSTLLGEALANGTTGAAPADTASALINMAHNPTANVGDLYGLVAAIPPFSPALTKQPTSFILPLSFTGGGITGGYYAAVDGSGNVWFTDYSSSSLSELSPLGVPLSPAAGFTGGGLKNPNGVVLDASGNAYVANNGSLSEFSPAGTAVTPAAGFTAGAVLGALETLSFDASGNLWVADYSSKQLRKVSTPGGLSLVQSYATGAAGPVGVAVNTQNEVWATAFDSSTLLALPSGAAAASIFTSAQLNKPVMIAIDAAQTEWIPNDNGNSVSHISSAGVPLSSTAYTGGGLQNPFGVAIDGAGRVWVTNAGANPTVSELDTTGVALSPSTGFASAGLSEPDGIAVDGSGNVWVTNQSSGNVVEFVGSATPVVTPLAVGVANNGLGARP